VKAMRRMAMAMAVLAAACAGNTAEEGEGQDDELSLGDFGVSASREDYNPRAMKMEFEEKIAECMRAQGWEYTPYVSASVTGGLGFSEYDEGEYRKTYGFGISTQSLLAEEEAEAHVADKEADPNAAITKRMSDDERAAYETALHGEQVEPLTEEELETMTDEELAEHNKRQGSGEGGCTEEVWRQVTPDTAFLEEFGDALEDVYERMLADPRVVKANADWSACMAERGHAFASQEEMNRYLYGEDPFGDEISEFKKRVNEASGFSDDDAATVQTDQVAPGGGAQTPPGTAPGGGAQTPPGTAPGGDADSPPGTAPGGDADSPPGTAPGGDADSPPGTAPGGGAQAPPSTAPGGDATGGDGADAGEPDFGIDMEKLQPLIDEEISMAVSDWDCGEDLRLLWEELFEEMERDFIDTNRERLLEFRERNQ